LYFLIIVNLCAQITQNTIKMDGIKIEINGIDLSQLAQKIDTLTNALSTKPEEPNIEPNGELFLTRVEVAKLLKVTLPTINDWTNKGLISAYRIGKLIRYKQSEILETISKNKTKR